MILSMFCWGSAYAEFTKPEYRDVVVEFVRAVKTDDPDKIGDVIDFPLGRSYPLPTVNDKKEFIQRYDEIFDEYLRTAIVNSDIDEDWADVGWRGIMFNRGILWLTHSGALRALNRLSEIEADKRRVIIEKERQGLHESLREFKMPEFIIETEKFKVRVDQMDGYKYRYASWPKGADMSKKPDLVINNGEIKYEGSGGNHYYKFKNGKYTYIVSVTVIGHSESAPYYLAVSHNDDGLLLDQPAYQVK
jgi:hypothetical protein